MRRNYGQAGVLNRRPSAPGATALPSWKSPVTTQKDELPDTAIKASLSCGNRTALAKLKPGEVVFDLGSSPDIDVLLSARRVGPTGQAYGLPHPYAVAMEAAMLAPNAWLMSLPDRRSLP